MDLFRKIFCRKQKNEKDKFMVSNVAFYTDDQLQIHKDKDTPKYWNGRIGEIHGDYCSVDCPELIREFPFPFQEGDEVLITIQKDDKHFRCRSTLIKVNFSHKPPVIDLGIPKPAEIKEPGETVKRLSHVDFPAKVRIDSIGEPWSSVRINEFGSSGLVFTSSEEYPSSKFLLTDLPYCN